MTRCCICGDEIFDEDERYELPGNDTVCTARTCILDWADQFKAYGHYVVPYIWIDDRC